MLSKKFASLERSVGETLYVANDITLATTSVTSVAQNIIFCLFKIINIASIQRLYAKI